MSIAPGSEAAVQTSGDGGAIPQDIPGQTMQGDGLPPIPAQTLSDQQAAANPATSSAGSAQTSDTSGSLPAPNPQGNAIVAAAEKYLGVPYKWGGESAGGVDCVREGSLVSTPFGPVAVQSLRPGDLVYSWLNGELAQRHVMAVVDKGVQSAVKVRLRNRTIVGTANHEVAVYRRIGRQRRTAWNLDWVPLSDLRRGDYLATLRATPTVAEPEVSADLAWLAGLFIGDGWYDDRHLMLCVFGALAEHTRDVLRRLYGLEARASKTAGLVVNSKAVVEEFKRLGLVNGSSGKRIPPWVFAAHPKTREAFLDGYRSADGHVDKKGWVTIHSVSRDLIEDARHLGIGLSMNVGNVRLTERTKPIVIKGKLVKNAKPIYSFQMYLGSHEFPKKWPIRDAQRIIHDGSFSAGKVLEVSSAGTEHMWDIEVAGSANFIADGVLVHNCSGLVQLAYKAAGLTIPRVSYQQASYGTTVPISQLRPGDLVAWDNNPNQPGADHIAIYAGSGKIIEAAHPGTNVRVRQLSSNEGAYGVRIGSNQ